MFPTPPPPEPVRRRRERQRTDDAVADAAEGADQALTGDGRERFLARITAAADPTGGAAVYAWEFAVPGADGTAFRDAAGFRGDAGDLPAWETTGNTRVPTDGTALVELRPGEGGNYHAFTWPERYTPARLVGPARAGSGGGASWRALEQLPQAGGRWADLPGGREFDPVYERGGLPATAGAVVFLERGLGASPDVVSSIDVHGVPFVTNPVHRVYLTNATGGTWALTLFDGAGNSQRTAPLPWDADAAAVQAALAVLGRSTTVTGSGTAADPFLVRLDYLTLDVPVTQGDPFGLRGLQEWLFDAGAGGGGTFLGRILAKHQAGGSIGSVGAGGVDDTQPDADPHVYYQWQRVEPELDNGQTVIDPAGAAGGLSLDDGPAFEQSGNPSVPVDGTIVRLWKGAGNYFFFNYPEPNVLARITAPPLLPFDGPAYEWVELQPRGDGGPLGFAEVGTGRGTDQTGDAASPNRAWEENGRLDVAAGTVVRLRRGRSPGAADVVAQQGPMGFDDVHEWYLPNAVGGSYRLTVFSPDGSQSATALVGFFDSNADVEDALNGAIDASIAPPFLVQVTAPGAAAPPGDADDPWIVEYLDAQLHPMIVGDPCGLISRQEWLFAMPVPAPCLDVQEKAVNEYPCEDGKVIWYHRVETYVCGALQFPLPEWENRGQVGCCPCPGSTGSLGSTGSHGSAGSAGSTADPGGYWCVVPYCCDSWTVLLSGIADAAGCTCSGLNRSLVLAPDFGNDLNRQPTFCQFIAQITGVPGCPNTVLKVILTSSSSSLTYTLTVKCYVSTLGEGNAAVVTYTGTQASRTDCQTPMTMTRQSYAPGTESPVCDLSGMPGTLTLTPNGNAAGANGCLPGCYPAAQLLGTLAVGRPVGYAGGVCLGVIVSGPFAAPDCGGECGGGSVGSGARYWCVTPAAGSTGSGNWPGSAGGGLEMAPVGTAVGGMAVGDAVTDCAASCQPESALAGSIVVGGAVTWAGGACSGTITAGPFPAADCGGECAGSVGSHGSITGTCCSPLPDILHVTLGGMLAGYGSVPVERAPGGSVTGPWRQLGSLTGPCGQLINLRCDCDGGRFIVQGGLYDGTGTQYAVFIASAYPQSCSPLDVQWTGTANGTNPPGRIILAGGGAPVCPLSDFSGMLTL